MVINYQIKEEPRLKNTTSNFERFTDKNLEWEILSVVKRKIETTPIVIAETFYIVYELSLRKDFSWYQEHALSDVMQLCYIHGFNTMSDYIVKDKNLAQSLLSLSQNVDSDIIRSLILNMGEIISGAIVRGNRRTKDMPDSIIDLTLALLAIKSKEEVADFCCGTGDFLVNAYMRNPESHLTGFEINSDFVEISKIRKLVVPEPENIKELIDIYSDNLQALVQHLEKQNNQIKIENKDILSDVVPLEDTNKAKKFDKVFCNPPMAIYSEPDTLKRNNLPFADRIRTMDWNFVAGVVQRLKDNGKGIILLPSGCAFSKLHFHRNAREYFVDHGFIESVICLPKRMFHFTNISLLLIVLSHGNENIRFVDASEVYERGRRINRFSEKNLETILNALNQDTGISKLPGKNEIVKKDFSIFPKDYVIPKEELGLLSEYGPLMPMEELTLSVSRGAPIMASSLDALSSEEDTGFDYITLADIQDGIVGKTLRHLTNIPKGYDKYLVGDKSIILSKVGKPAKFAIVHVPEGSQIMATGNLFVLELNRDKIDPYYLLAFFDSPEGNRILNHYYDGLTIPSIRIQSLKKIKIPVPSMEKQKIVAQKYRQYQKDLVTAKELVQKLIQSRTDVFDEGMKEG